MQPVNAFIIVTSADNDNDHFYYARQQELL